MFLSPKKGIHELLVPGMRCCCRLSGWEIALYKVPILHSCMLQPLHASAYLCYLYNMAYHLIYGLLYLVSLLPFRLFYGLGWMVYALLYYIVRYRRNVVAGNLAIAFPEKSAQERKQIEKQFYKNFVDTFVETIKCLSISTEEFDRRCVGDFSAVNKLLSQGRNFQFLGAHLFNWEYANLVISRRINTRNIGVYGAIKNPIFERIFLKLRSRFGSILVSTAAFRQQAKALTAEQYAMYLVADQNPRPQDGYWMYLFSQPAPFIPGPHRASLKTGSVIAFIQFRRLKRGYYSFDVIEIIEDPSYLTPITLARKYRDFLEQVIREQPDNYLWSHRRWRHSYYPEFAANWIDDRAAAPPEMTA
jgi:KDO2-lipid IV(A) lauroyltransferase